MVLAQSGPMTTLVLIALLVAATPQESVAPPAAAAPNPAVPQAVLDVMALQVALDRAGFSSGVIDGRIGSNTKRAMEAYRRQNGSDPAPTGSGLVEYRITTTDAAGPFVDQIPKDLVEQSKLPALAYTSVIEMLAERFHTTPDVLRQINAGATFAADTAIFVPNVEPIPLPAVAPPAVANGASSPQQGAAQKPQGVAGTTGRSTPPATDKGAKAVLDRPDVVITVSRSASAVTVTDASGKTVVFAPVTTGSENDPLPIGEWKVNGVQYNPPFKYNPDLFWDADPAHTKATIPPGPNGPVGIVWIDISKDHYGLHGSPEPSQIGKTQSHGCVRMTNWDALRVAALVKPGTRVVFTD
jgi:lipoprotein-anchoring transpeptidase ErfK/SrfK